MGYSVEDFFFPSFTMDNQVANFKVSVCKCCWALVSDSGKRYHAEYHNLHRDMPRQK